MNEISKCQYCGSTNWTFEIVGLTTEIVCGNCHKMPYEKDPKDILIENHLIDEIDKYDLNKGHWKKNES